ncbi:hypothetical protein QWY28_11015 [Nocardioides sp. SOB77]|uniref:Type IV toxin-antitoxin system AbiEi family antitoxin domain-containing protein n=1 Tax=Nocardioides oceani TaxID=3058369 RepID=A0ABT8FFK9_9ACTN|nr:hypothetical protein [Nocardioides oceani]MDN4173476.1 hypothetical protein [Nocardioides oceani]
MRPALRAIADRQSGLVLRHQVAAAGYSDRDLRSHLALHGSWTGVRRGVYAESSVWDALDPVGRWRLRDLAVHLTTDVEHAMSVDSAARALGLPFVMPAQPMSHLVRPGRRGTRSERGVKHHLSRRMPEPLVEVEGMTVTPLARTALDIAREHGFEAGVAACDGAMRRGVSRQVLERELDVMTSWPFITRARPAVEHADAGAENVAESYARILVAELGRGRPSTQFPVRVASGVVWCDLQLGNHVFEFDGRIKYVDQTHGGVADLPVDRVVWEEKKRQREVEAVGLGLSRIIWADFFAEGRAAARTRLLADVEISDRRFGPVLAPHLAEDAARLRLVREARIFRSAS